jgi:cyclase
VFRPRVIPVILVNELGHAVKTRRFKKPIDLGDSVNTVSLFNAFKVDELVLLDIAASSLNRRILDQLMADIASEAQMPLAVGGGVRTCDDIYTLLHAGAEKVVIRSAALSNPHFVQEATKNFASSSITVCIDVRRDWLGRYQVYPTIAGAQRMTPSQTATLMEDMGAGEIIVQSVEQDGRMEGYDERLITMVADAVGIPVIALGGAGTFDHIRATNLATNASAFASGSMFCFQNSLRGVLISYPSQSELASLTSEA